MVQNIAGCCQQTFEYKRFVDNVQQCFAFAPQAHFPAHNLNFQSRLPFKIFSHCIFSSGFVKGFRDGVGRRCCVLPRLQPYDGHQQHRGL